MTLRINRRGILGFGCFLAAGLRSVHSAGLMEITMNGTDDGSRVWFEPVGLHVPPGTTIRWTNRDQGNTHSSTAYHPDNDGHPLRIPSNAKAWNSDLLLPGQHFEVTLRVEGVYDYFCLPHEMAGMSGRIIVGTPPSSGFWNTPTSDVPPPAWATLPAVELILEKGRVERQGQT